MAAAFPSAAAAAGGRCWISRVVAPRGSDSPSPLCVQGNRTIASPSLAQGLGAALKGVAAAGERRAREAGSTPCVVVAAQHSTARIEKSNRRSRFREQLETTDCEEDDELCQALYPDVHLLREAKLEEDTASHQSYRKEKKLSKITSKRLNFPTDVRGVRASAEHKKPASRYNKPKIQVKPTAAGRSVKSSEVSRFRKERSSLVDSFFDSVAWEEQAYKIIQQQKLRDTSAIRILPAEEPKRLSENLSGEACIPSSNSSRRFRKVSKDTESLEAGDSHLLSLLGLEDKCGPLLEYLHSLGLREQDFTRILDRHRASLQADVDAVKERIAFLLDVGVQFEDLRKMLVRHPQVVEYRVDQAMRPRILYLKSLGLEESKIGKVITASPSLLECSLERSVQPRVAYLVKNLGIRMEDIGKIVMRSPQILTQSIDESLEPRLDFFLNELKISRPALAKMVTRHPQLFHYSIEFGIQPRVKYLRSIGMTNDDVVKVVTRLTQVLSLSVKNSLRPKFNYLVEELKGNAQTVTSFPAYFSLSLDQRIVPRHRYLTNLQRAPRGPFPMRLLAISDAAFCQWADTSVEAYSKFRHDLLLTSFAKKFEWKNNVHL